MGRRSGSSAGERRRSTIYDVAKEAGVSAATVSHVLNGTATISEATRERVMAAIESQDYRPNNTARTVRKRRSGIIGLVTQDMTSQFYSIMYERLLVRAQEAGYITFLTCGQQDSKLTRSNIEMLIEHQVDGMILVGNGYAEESLQAAEKYGVPVVLCDQYAPNFHSVEFDNFNTMRRLVHCLCGEGMRRLAYIGVAGADGHENLYQRYRGFQQGMLDEGLNPDRYNIVLSREESKYFKYNREFRVFSDFLQKMPKEEWPEAVFASHDAIAQIFIASVLRSGGQVPQDMWVLGFDDTSHAFFSAPSISTVHQDPLELADESLQMLIARMEKKDCRLHKVLQQKIVIRESAPIAKYLLQREKLEILVDERSVAGAAGQLLEQP